MNDMATSTATSNVTADFSLKHDEWGRLNYVDAAGTRHERVSVVRAFPITDPDRMVAIIGTDGHELLFISDLSHLPAAIRHTLEEELARREFLPVIERIVKVSGRIEPCEWQVETDHGPRKFVLAAYEDVHRLANHRALVFDGEGTRYLIPDVRALDPTSRGHLDRYL